MNESVSNEQQLLADNDVLDRVSRMKAEFFGAMNHNIKTPLTIISSCLHSMSDMITFGDIDEDEMKEMLGIAQREVMRLSEMLRENIRNMSSFDTHQGMEAIDTAQFLTETAGLYHTMLERRFNTLKTEIPQNLPAIHGNKDMLAQVMANLISNANRYTSGGVITIAAEGCGEFVKIIVRDSGTGIKPELLPNLFERGVSDGGTGLGLYICKMIVEEMHKGVLSAESSDAGTTFSIELPVSGAGGGQVDE